MPTPCSWCHGKGIWSSGCDGLVDCDSCSGTGYLDRGDCTACNGTGFRESLYNENRPRCVTCDGTGYRDRRPA